MPRVPIKRNRRSSARWSSANTNRSADPSSTTARPAGSKGRPAGRSTRWLASRWQEQAALAGILVARSSLQGQIAGGTFLVDLACLRVKSSAVRLFKSWRDYDRDMRQRILERQPMMPADINLVAKIVETGVEYARSLGFDPTRPITRHACSSATPIPRHPL